MGIWSQEKWNSLDYCSWKVSPLVFRKNKYPECVEIFQCTKIKRFSLFLFLSVLSNASAKLSIYSGMNKFLWRVASSQIFLHSITSYSSVKMWEFCCFDTWILIRQVTAFSLENFAPVLATGIVSFLRSIYDPSTFLNLWKKP